MNKIFSLFQLFQLGSAVVDPAKWKAHQINANMIAALLLALCNAAPVFGVSLPFIPDAGTVNMLAAGFLAVVNSVLTLVTSAKVGMVPGNVSDMKTTLIPGVVATKEGEAMRPLAPSAANVQSEFLNDKSPTYFGE